jgi:hypothetical protein
MAFTVQTLPPTANANAYITVAFFRDYHLERGRDFSNLTNYPDAKVQACIINATQYLDLRFEYVGYRVQADQTTEWPRSSAFNNRGDLLTGIPLAVQRATAEYAYRALTADLLADPTRDASGQAIKSKSETVGPISERVEYVDYLGYELPEYPLADRLLIVPGLTVDGGSSNRGGLQSGNIQRG